VPSLETFCFVFVEIKAIFSLASVSVLCVLRRFWDERSGLAHRLHLRSHRLRARAGLSRPSLLCSCAHPLSWRFLYPVLDSSVSFRCVQAVRFLSELSL
jgi:hypothetical protein